MTMARRPARQLMRPVRPDDTRRTIFRIPCHFPLLRTLSGAALLVCLTLAAAGPANAQDGGQGEDIQDIGYKVVVDGPIGNGLKGELRAASRLAALEDYPPLTIGALRSRARADVDRLAAVLRSEGYYGADISLKVDDSTDPVSVIFTVDAGMRYVLKSISVQFTSDAVKQPTDGTDYGLVVGGGARAPDVVAAGEQVLNLLGQRGYPFAKMADRKVVVNHDTQSMAVTFVVDAGPLTRFDGLAIKGLTSVKPDFVKSFRLWDKGQLYDQRLVDEMRSDLIDANLFASVGVTPEKPATDGGEGTLDLDLVEAPHRTVGGGANYSTSEGLGANAFWEHRNFFGRGERFRASATAAELRQELGVELHKPHFLSREQGLTLSTNAKHENSDAYEEFTLSVGAALDRELAQQWQGSAGTTLELTEIHDAEGTRSFLLLGLPLGVRFDGTDSLLDPTRGARLQVSTTPYASTLDTTGFFMVNEVNASTYYKVTDSPRLVLAGRMRAGSIFGSSRADIPATKRFYAGGGGSIRGIAYQAAGPLDADGNPIGGRSVAETSVEARFKVTRNIGIVPFIDGGTVYTDVLPRFNDFQWGGGVGLRYHTPVGPIRLDVALPINAEPGHKALQLYISLGQAF